MAEKELIEKFHLKRGLLEFKLLSKDDEENLRKATNLENEQWGEILLTNVNKFRERAANGYVIAAFKQGELVGTISTLRVKNSHFEKIGKQETWVETWNGVTGNGTFNSNDQVGKVLCCVAVTAKSEKRLEEIPKEDWLSKFNGKITKKNLLLALQQKNFNAKPEMNEFVFKLANSLIDDYLKTNLDYVIRFHRKPKAGLEKGAEIWIKVPNGQPSDLDSIGFNVILRYPQISSREVKQVSSEEPSIGEGLVEAAYELGKMLDTVSIIAPYSRPAQLRATLAKALQNEGKEDEAGKTDEEKVFWKKVNAKVSELLGEKLVEVKQVEKPKTKKEKKSKVKNNEFT